MVGRGVGVAEGAVGGMVCGRAVQRGSSVVRSSVVNCIVDRISCLRYAD